MKFAFGITRTGTMEIRTFCTEGCPDEVSLYLKILFIQGKAAVVLY
jgi:hypothetical protein